MKRLLLGLGYALIGAAIALPPAAAQSAAGARSSGVQRPATQLGTVKPATPAAREPSVRSRGWASGLLNFAAGGLLGILFGGDSLFGILMVLLLVAIGVSVVRIVMRGRETAAPAAPRAGLGADAVLPPLVTPASPVNAIAPTAGTPPALPAGFDLAGFVRTAKLNFVRLQVATDLGRLDEVREISMPQMFAQLSKDAVAGGGSGRLSDVVSLNAELVELVTEGDLHRASVRFSGMAREKPGLAPAGFAETWMLAKPANESTAWRLAGVRRAE